MQKFYDKVFPKCFLNNSVPSFNNAIEHCKINHNTCLYRIPVKKMSLQKMFPYNSVRITLLKIDASTFIGGYCYRISKSVCIHMYAATIGIHIY